MVKRKNSLSLSSLDQLGLAVYSYLLGRLSFSAIPKPVPLVPIAVACGCSVEQVKYRVKKLEEKGIIQVWRKKHPTHFKVTYYRIVYTGDKRALYRKKHP